MSEFIDYWYDWENYPNFSCVTIFRASDLAWWTFEISEWVNQGVELNYFLTQVANSKGRMIGFNNRGYDYPITHTVMKYQGRVSPQILYNHGQNIIHTDNRFEYVVWERDMLIPQLDLMLIHHFDNKAKATSLKLLEFNMRMLSIQELPYDPLLPLTYDESRNVIKYNKHDDIATFKFHNFTLEQIKFREELSERYGVDFTNFNDTKIGAEIVSIELRKAGVTVNKHNQTIRTRIPVNDIIFDYVRFESPEFNNVLNFFRGSVIDPDKIKGFFKDKGSDDEETKFTSATIDGFTFDFGAGGIHGSIKKELVKSDDEYFLYDWDVEGFYPEMSVANKIHPEHLGPAWYETMDYLGKERNIIGKKTALGNAYKLGRNGSYGKTNDKFSPLLDAQYTVQITINGQLLLSMLAEQLMKVPGMRMVQINTDGLTFLCPKKYHEHCMSVSAWWEQLTNLKLEHVLYSMMAVRDVNNYLAVNAPQIIENGIVVDDPTNVKIKRIGAYAYVRAEEDSSTRELPWNKNHSMIVVAKAAEAAIVHGKDIREFIENHVTVDPWDFFSRVKVPRKSLLLASNDEKDKDFVRPFIEDARYSVTKPEESRLPNITRYYVSNSGQRIFKVMTPTSVQIKNWLEVPHWQHVVTGVHKCSKNAPSKKWVQVKPPSDKPPMREIGVESGFRVFECNEVNEQTLKLKDLNIDYYVEKTKKLVDIF